MPKGREDVPGDRIWHGNGRNWSGLRVDELGPAQAPARLDFRGHRGKRERWRRCFRRRAGGHIYVRLLRSHGYLTERKTGVKYAEVITARLLQDERAWLRFAV